MRKQRCGANQLVYEDLLERVARAARLADRQLLPDLLPTFTSRERSNLRCARRDYFGWDRLHEAAVALGVEVAPIWAKHQPSKSLEVAA